MAFQSNAFQTSAFQQETPVAALQTKFPPLTPEIETVDQAGFAARISGLIPFSWFDGNDDTPVYNVVINGAAYPLAEMGALFQYALNQNRIGTATGVWLDRIAYDFFGPSFPRKSWNTANGTTAYEQDDAYRARVIEQILAPKATRLGINDALVNLTGRSPVIIEAFNPNDCSAYSEASYYGQVGIYGSLLCHNQVFVTAFRPFGEGIPNIAGYSYGYYGGGTTAYIDISQITGNVVDSQIYAAGAETVAAGIVCWMDIEDIVKPTPILLNLDFGNAINSQNIIPWFTG
jgi:hypothetical protein